MDAGLSIQIITIWLVGVLILLFAATVSVGSSKTSSRLFGSAAFSVAAWCLALGAFFSATDPATIEFANRLAFGAGALVATTFLYFTLSLGTPARYFTHIGAVLAGLLTTLWYWLFTSTHLVRGVRLTQEPLLREFLLGRFGWVFYLYFATLFCAGFAVLFKKWQQQTDEHERWQLKVILFSSLISSTLATITAVGLPLLGNHSLYWLGPLCAAPWLISSTYAIAQHRMLRIRPALAELIVFVLSVLLFIQVLYGRDANVSLFNPQAAIPYVALAHAISGILAGSFSVAVLLAKRTARLYAIALVSTAAAAGHLYIATTVPRVAPAPETLWLPVTTVILIAATYLLAVRNYVSRTSLFLAELLIVAMLMLIAGNIIITDSVIGFIARVAILTAFLIAGAIFVRATYVEERQRERLGELTDRMQELNANLESIVLKRTEEINRARIHATTIVEQLNHGLLETLEDGTIVRFNLRAEELLRTRRDELLGKPRTAQPKRIQIVTAPYRGPKEETILPSPPTANKSVDVKDLQLPESDLFIRIITMPLAGTKTHVRLVRDITHEVRILQSKNDFVSLVAHQLRTPLAGIKWALEDLLENAKRLTKKQADRLMRIQTMNDILLSLIADLAITARIEEGTLNYEMEQLSLTALVRDALKEVRATASSRNITIQTDIAKNVLLISADKKLMTRTLKSAIDNALRYSKEGAAIEVQLRSENNAGIFTVRDSGIGISQNERKELFTKFYRSAQAIKMHTEGAGLSLFIAKHVVERHGGTIEVESKEGYGTACRIAMPLV